MRRATWVLRPNFMHGFKADVAIRSTEFMSSIRIWLDRRRIDLVGFAPVPVTYGIVAFDVYFRNEQDVVLFQQEFGRRRVSRTPLSSNDRFPEPL